MSLGGFEYQSGSELQAFLKNPTTGRNIHWEHPAPSPHRPLFPTWDAWVRESPPATASQKHKKKTWETWQNQLLGTLASKYIMSFIINNVRAIFSQSFVWRVSKLLGLFYCSPAFFSSCLPRSKALPNALFPRDGQHGMAFAGGVVAKEKNPVTRNARALGW